MVSQRALAFTADLDISDVSRGLRRIEMQSRRAGAMPWVVSGAGVGRDGGQAVRGHRRRRGHDI